MPITVPVKVFFKIFCFTLTHTLLVIFHSFFPLLRSVFVVSLKSQKRGVVTTSASKSKLTSQAHGIAARSRAMMVWNLQQLFYVITEEERCFRSKKKIPF